MGFTTLLAMLLAAQAGPPAAPAAESGAIVAGHMLPIAETGDGYSGPGWDRLVAEAADAQFFLIGEQHGTRDIALFATRVHAELARRGYTHAAVEIGPWSTGFAERLIRSGHGRLGDYIRRPGHALTLPFLFFGEETVLAEQIVAASPDGEQALWGLDQEFVASGPVALALLRGWARTEAHSAAVEAFGARVESDPMLVGNLTDAELDPLAGAFAGHAEAPALIEELRRSSAIYAPFVRRTGPIYPANLRREQQMKLNFVRAFEAAERRTGTPPRVFLKVGGNHAMRGFSGTNVPGLGNFLAEWGLARGFGLVNIMVDCAGGEALNPQTNVAVPCQPDLGPDTLLGSIAGEQRLTMIDLKALRPRLRELRDLDEHSRRAILAFDYYLVIRDVRAATPTAPLPVPRP